MTEVTYIIQLLADQPLWVRIGFFIFLAVATHLLVILMRTIANRLVLGGQLRNQKAHSVITLTTSALIFALYFFVIGLILQELNVSLTAYLASASVIGLAVGFGSQGIVQDVVMGITIIFSDLLDVGDLVEVGGQTGKVKRITMRFVELENALGAQVFIPNRTINNVINYPRGYIRCLVDVSLLGDADAREKMAECAVRRMRGIYEQFPGILLTEPSVVGRQSVVSGKDFLRIKFRIWPNRGQPIETTFVKELSAELKTINDSYQDWMIAVYYEVEEK